MPNQFKENVQFSIFDEVCDRNLKLIRLVDKLNIINQKLLTKIDNLQGEKQALNKDFDDLREEFKENLRKLERQHEADVNKLRQQQALNKPFNISFDDDSFLDHSNCFLLLLLISLLFNIQVLRKVVFTIIKKERNKIYDKC